MYMAVYIPVVFVSAWVIGRFGLRKAMVFAAFLNALGGLVRYLGSDDYDIVLLGQVSSFFIIILVTSML